MSYLLLSLLWIIYFILHSALAADTVKLFFQRNSGRRFRYYRIVYSIVSSVGLLVILIYQGTIPSILLFTGTDLTRYLSLTLATVGVIIISMAFREHRFLSFIGLNEEVIEFRRSGILNYVRHPIYSGTILIMVGIFVFNPTLASIISLGCVLLYLPIGIYLEENKLIRLYGDRYLTYKKEVPALIPRFKKR